MKHRTEYADAAHTNAEWVRSLASFTGLDVDVIADLLARGELDQLWDERGRPRFRGRARRTGVQARTRLQNERLPDGRPRLRPAAELRRLEQRRADWAINLT